MNTSILRSRFPVAAAAALAAVMILAFSRTYYLRAWFDLPPLSRLAHVHGLLSTLWLALHFTQAKLVAARRVDLHRRLGIFTAFVGFVLAAQALQLGIEGVAAGRAPPGRDPLQFLSVPVGTTTMFTTFLVGALVLRGRREWHKRLMFLATLALLIPAAGRLDTMLAPYGMPRRVIGMILTVGFILWGWWDDWLKRGRIHPAYLYGGAVLTISVPLRAWIGMQAWWLPIAQRIIG